MGFSNLGAELIKTKLSISDIENKKIAIDFPILLHKITFRVLKNNSHINVKNFEDICELILNEFRKLNSWFNRNKITPYYVFEKAPLHTHELKKYEREKREKINNRLLEKYDDLINRKLYNLALLHKIQYDLIFFFKHKYFNIIDLIKKTLLEEIKSCILIESFYESELACCILYKNNLVDYILSADYDILAYGCSHINDISKLEYFDVNKIIEKFEISLNQLKIVLSSISNDYFTGVEINKHKNILNNNIENKKENSTTIKKKRITLGFKKMLSIIKNQNINDIEQHLEYLKQNYDLSKKEYILIKKNI